MDFEQFKNYMQAITTQQQTLINTIANIVSGKEKTPETASNLSNLIPFEHFDSNKDKFSCYLERFENYSSMKNVTDKGKLAQLLCVSIDDW